MTKLILRLFVEAKKPEEHKNNTISMTTVSRSPNFHFSVDQISFAKIPTCALFLRDQEGAILPR